jgi:hypothetical protein
MLPTKNYVWEDGIVVNERFLYFVNEGFLYFVNERFLYFINEGFLYFVDAVGFVNAIALLVIIKCYTPWSVNTIMFT